MASQQELYLHDAFTHQEIPFAPFASRRSVVYGTKGMICCSQPLAAEAGLEILRKGGNAADAGKFRIADVALPLQLRQDLHCSSL